MKKFFTSPYMDPFPDYEQRDVSIPLITLQYFKNLLTVEECKQFIDKAESSNEFKKSDVNYYGIKKSMPEIRNNHSMYFSDVEFSAKLYDSIKDSLPIMGFSKNPIKLKSYFSIYKYNKGEYFKMHKDGSVVENNLKSLKSFLIFLNDDFEGGQTLFKFVSEDGTNNKKIIVKPETGLGFIFDHNT